MFTEVCLRLRNQLLYNTCFFPAADNVSLFRYLHIFFTDCLHCIGFFCKVACVRGALVKLLIHRSLVIILPWPTLHFFWAQEMKIRCSTRTICESAHRYGGVCASLIFLGAVWWMHKIGIEIFSQGRPILFKM